MNHLSAKAWLFDFDQSQVSPAFYSRLVERYATPPEERLEPANERPLRRTDYAAPEVKAGGVCTPASDVFALGLLLYRLLTGFRPFPAQGGEPTPARKVCPACPVELERLLALMLDADPGQRPSLAVVQETLECELELLAAEHEAEEEQGAGCSATTEPAVLATDRPVAPEQSVVAPGDTAPSDDPAVAAAGETTASAIDVPQTNPAAHGPPRAVRRRSLLLLACMIAAGFVLGRTTVSPEQPAQEPSSAAAISSMNDTPSAREAARSAQQEPPLTAPDITMIEREDVSSTAGTRTKNTVGTNEGTGSAAPRPARTAVTATEATAAMRRRITGLRRCAGVPPVLTVDLDIVRGLGVVTGLNTRAPAAEDPSFPWHACALWEFERVRFPISETPARVRVRLALE